MAIVSVAILVSFHLKQEATELEKRFSLPFGLLFWLLAFSCLVAGLSNYIKTVNRYSRRQALVQSGVGTQVVSFLGLAKGMAWNCTLVLTLNRSSRLCHVRSLRLVYCSFQRMLRRNRNEDMYHAGDAGCARLDTPTLPRGEMRLYDQVD